MPKLPWKRKRPPARIAKENVYECGWGVRHVLWKERYIYAATAKEAERIIRRLHKIPKGTGVWCFRAVDKGQIPARIKRVPSKVRRSI